MLSDIPIKFQQELLQLLMCHVKDCSEINKSIFIDSGEATELSNLALIAKSIEARNYWQVCWPCVIKICWPLGGVETQ